MFSLFVEGIFGETSSNKIITQKERLTNIIRFFLFIFHPYPSPQNKNLNLSKKILFLAEIKMTIIKYNSRGSNGNYGKSNASEEIMVMQWYECDNITSGIRPYCTY